MTSDLLIRYLHFIAVFVMFSMLTVQHLLLKGRVEANSLKKAAKFDMVYGISALIAFLCGLGLWLWVGKPAGFYNGNWVFHLKITLFIFAGILSLVPTRFLFLNRTAQNPITVPTLVTILLRVQLCILCVLPLLAVMMANGIGYTQ